jgi:probable phosphoglycerate mutase
MDDVVFARHAQSEMSARRLVGGDAPLTERGRAQAAELGRAIDSLPFDVCLTSAALRARETAAIALAGRAVPTEVVVELGDVDFGEFEGRPLEQYRAWIAAHPPDAAPPGGESRVATLRRFCRAFRTLLARPERHVLVVAHGLTMNAAQEFPPRPVIGGADYASWSHVQHDELQQAVARLERWCEAPSW